MPARFMFAARYMSLEANPQLQASSRSSSLIKDAQSPKPIPFSRSQPYTTEWCRVVEVARGLHTEIPAKWLDLFGPIALANRSETLVVGQLGQSLDGRIATHTGHSKYINGEPGLLHLHRLRALVDAVVVGVGTAIADDPQLNVRNCTGDHPARVVIDPNGRLPTHLKFLADDGIRAIIITGFEANLAVPPHIEIIRLPKISGRISPNAIVAALSHLGLRRILIEGGANTVSGFIQAKALDRLHMLVAPIIIGSGQPGLGLPRIDLIDDALRPHTKVHVIGNEVVFDCDFSACK